MVTTAAVLLISTLAFGQQNPDWGREFGSGQVTPLPPSLQKPPSGFGLGFHLGVPSGFAFSHKQKRSLQQATIGWNLGKSSLRVTADQVWTFYQHEPEPKLHFPVSFGIGGFVYLNEENKDALIGDTYRDIYGLRFPLVLAVNHDEVAIDGYFELVPRFSIVPSTEMDLIGGVGCRAYFF